MKSGVDQKVSKNLKYDAVQLFHVAENKNPIFMRVAPKATASKHTRAELIGALKITQSDINKAKKTFDVAKKLAEALLSLPQHGWRQQSKRVRAT